MAAVDEVEAQIDAAEERWRSGRRVVQLTAWIGFMYGMRRKTSRW